MRGYILKTALEAVGDSTIEVGALLEIFLKTRYGDSGGLRRKFAAKIQELEEGKTNRENSRAARQKFATFLYQLKRNGLLREQNSGNGRKLLSITQKGKEKIKKLETGSAILPDTSRYISSASGVFTLVMFDIPEKQKPKREWLRRALAQIGLSPVQKSVWLGKIKIPEEFVRDMKNIKILDFVEILEISKTGTLKKLG